MNAYGAYSRAAASYRQTGRTTAADDPRKRLEITLAGTLTTLAKARNALATGNIAERGEQVSRAITLISVLRTALDHDAAPELAQRLDQLYDYCNRRLLAFNAGQHEVIDEVIQLIVTLKDGWDATPADSGA
ncbi:MAG: flagellar protein FliS [Nevskiaceae bacterium]|nr:MAG: flagellar protein FliS [Nevskiaceae bacterium]TBR71567.1 MAG: flagellar protein FliS [Nevskiaceae bacterium]